MCWWRRVTNTLRWSDRSGRRAWNEDPPTNPDRYQALDLAAAGTAAIGPIAARPVSPAREEVAMFAPRIAYLAAGAQTKAITGSLNGLAPKRSTLIGHRP